MFANTILFRCFQCSTRALPYPFHLRCMQGDPDGGYVGAAFKKAIFDVDDSRPVTANSEDTPGDTLTKVMDVNSFSYNYQEYDDFHIKYPFRTIIGGESASCVSDRSTYLAKCQGPGKGGGRCNDPDSGHVDSDAARCATSAWGTSAAERKWIAGNFAWTGLDYKGEPTPTKWRTINSHFGIKDIAGFDKDDTSYYYSWWRNETSHLHILPSDWNSPVPVGQPINCAIFSAAAQVELSVNGVSLGKKKVPHGGVVQYDQTLNGDPIVFKPGKLEATSWDAAGNVLARANVTTTGPATTLKLSLDKPGIGSLRVSGPVDSIKADGQDVALVRVQVMDASGMLVPSANHNISFVVSGLGVIYGVGNGDPSDHDPDKAQFRKAYKGLARVLVQSSRGDRASRDRTMMRAEPITLTATAPGLTAGKLEIPLSNQS
jgi:beta-galactosidase